MTGKRRAELSLMNVLFCLLVIFIHIISYPVSAFPLGSIKYTAAMLPWRLSSFVVQGFVLLSGVKLFLNGRDDVHWGRYLQGRLRGVFLPYVLCFFVYYLYYMLQYDYPADIAFFAEHLLWGSLVCHLYFIPLLFQFDLLFPIWKRLVHRVSGVILIPFALLLTMIAESYLPTIGSTIFEGAEIIYNDRLFTTYLSYWLIGCYIGKHYDAFCTLLKQNFKAIAVLFTLIAILCMYFSYLAYNQLAYVPYMNAWHSLYCLAAILFCFAIAQKVAEPMLTRLPGIKAIDRASFPIYLWHMLVLLVTNTVLEKIGIIAQMPCFFLRCMVVYGVTITVCVGCKQWKTRKEKG